MKFFNKTFGHNMLCGYFRAASYLLYLTIHSAITIVFILWLYYHHSFIKLIYKFLPNVQMCVMQRWCSCSGDHQGAALDRAWTVCSWKPFVQRGVSQSVHWWGFITNTALEPVHSIHSIYFCCIMSQELSINCSIHIVYTNSSRNLSIICIRAAFCIQQRGSQVYPFMQLTISQTYLKGLQRLHLRSSVAEGKRKRKRNTQKITKENGQKP